jgi:hypothetical protein
MIKFYRCFYPDKDGVGKNQKVQYTFVYENICESKRLYTDNIKGMATGKCIYCGKKFEGRADKKYCSDACRTSYSNDLKTRENEEIRSIRLSLRKNRNILKKLIGKKQDQIIPKETLEHNGFLFDYHTHFFTSELQKNVFTFCYDYGYREIGNKKFKIIRRWGADH